MFWTSHLALGLVIGQHFHAYPLAIIMSIIIDIDHVFPLLRHGFLFHPVKLYNYVTDHKDVIQHARSFLHNIIIVITLCSLSFLISTGFGLVFTISYIGHLLLDALDDSEFRPFYPSAKNIEGPLRYLGTGEWLLTVGLLTIFIIRVIY